MTTLHYRLTRKATEDVRTIYRQSVELFGEQQAIRYHESLEQIFELLVHNPQIARLRREIDPPVRVHPHGAHLVIYKEQPEMGILIIRIRHGRENWQDA